MGKETITRVDKTGLSPKKNTQIFYSIQLQETFVNICVRSLIFVTNFAGIQEIPHTCGLEKRFIMKTVLKSPTVTLYCSKAGFTVRPYQIKTRLGVTNELLDFI